MVSFTLKQDSEKAAKEVVCSTKLFKLAESLGGVKSLLCHPATMTHKSIPAEKRQATGVSDSLIRLSVGLEDVEDLLQDIDQALNKIAGEDFSFPLASPSGQAILAETGEATYVK